MERRYPDADKYVARQRLGRTLGILAISLASLVTAGLVYVAFAVVP